MTKEEVIKAIESAPKGANIKAEWERPVHLRAAYKGLPLFKRTRMNVRIGIENDTREAVKAARESGDRPAENQGLSGLEWVKAPFLLRSIKSPENFFLRMEPPSNRNDHGRAIFFIREAGIETTVKKADYVHMMLGSETKPKKYDGCFNIGIEKILSLHTVVAGEMEETEEGEMEVED